MQTILPCGSVGYAKAYEPITNIIKSQWGQVASEKYSRMMYLEDSRQTNIKAAAHQVGNLSWRDLRYVKNVVCVARETFETLAF